MSCVLLMVLFLFKHGLLCHAVDFGYSLSRKRSARSWYLGLLAHATAELLVTLYILRNQSWSVAGFVLVLEHTALILSGLIERKATLRKLLSTHVYCELAVMLTYGFIAYRLADG